MKRSIRAVTTGNGSEPSSSTASWNARMSNLKLAHSPTCSSLPTRLYLDHSHGPVLAPATQLTRRYPPRLCLLCRFSQTLHSLNRDVFYVADPISSIETRSLPAL